MTGPAVSDLSTEQIRDRILEQALPNVVFDGWTWDLAQASAENLEYDKSMALAVFPGRLNDFVGHFADWADRRMLDTLSATNPDDLRVRDRIRAAVLARIDGLTPWREAERKALTFWSMPPRNLLAVRMVWRTADRIWDWAGDTATDYNRYTKRILLSGVLTTTMLAWLNQDQDDRAALEVFLDRRIDHVLKLGKFVGRFKKSA